MPSPFATSTSWVCPGSPRNLNSPNRPVRTRMPGGVAGDPRDCLGPLCRFGALEGHTEEPFEKGLGVAHLPGLDVVYVSETLLTNWPRMPSATRRRRLSSRAMFIRSKA